MRNFLTVVVATAFVAAASLVTAVSPANAYDYTIVSSIPLKSVWLHTVSAFCHDRSWSGDWRTQPNPIQISTASICLVDQVQVTAWNDMNASWSGIGVPGQTIQVWYSQQNGVYIDMSSGGGMLNARHKRAAKKAASAPKT